MVALIVLSSICFYAFMAGLCGSKHHAIATKKCQYKGECLKSYWCGHVWVSVYFIGLLWPLAAPTMFGVRTGTKNRPSRVELRRQREIEEAKHQAELARYRRMEDEELDKQLGRI